MTFLEVVNMVLRRLRENPATSVADDEYTMLIGEFVNDIKEEMEELEPWKDQRQTVTFDSVVDQNEYDLTTTNPRSKFLFDRRGPCGRPTSWVRPFETPPDPILPTNAALVDGNESADWTTYVDTNTTVAIWSIDAQNQGTINWSSGAGFTGLTYGAVVWDVPANQVENAAEGAVTLDLSGQPTNGSGGAVGIGLQHNEINFASMFMGFVVAHRTDTSEIQIWYGASGTAGDIQNIVVSDISNVKVGLRIETPGSDSEISVFVDDVEQTIIELTYIPGSGWPGKPAIAFTGSPSNNTNTAVVKSLEYSSTAGVVIDDGTYTPPPGTPIYEDSSITYPWDWDEYRFREELDGSKTSPLPQYWAWRSGQNNLKVGLWPAPDNANLQYRFECHVPQDRLELDGTDDATVVTVPWRPLYLGALYLALNERGEEMGEPGGIADRRYREALWAAKDENSHNEQEFGNLDMQAN